MAGYRRRRRRCRRATRGACAPRPLPPRRAPRTDAARHRRARRGGRRLAAAAAEPPPGARPCLARPAGRGDHAAAAGPRRRAARARAIPQLRRAGTARCRRERAGDLLSPHAQRRARTDRALRPVRCARRRHGRGRSAPRTRCGAGAGRAHAGAAQRRQRGHAVPPGVGTGAGQDHGQGRRGVRHRAVRPARGRRGRGARARHDDQHAAAARDAGPQPCTGLRAPDPRRAGWPSAPRACEPVARAALQRGAQGHAAVLDAAELPLCGAVAQCGGRCRRLGRHRDARRAGAFELRLRAVGERTRRRLRTDRAGRCGGGR
ncbi:hypothetical protein D9M68_610890 [compost metagenome]